MELPNKRYPIFNVSLTVDQYLTIQRALFELLAKNPDDAQIASTYLLFEAAPKEVNQ